MSQLIGLKMSYIGNSMYSIRPKNSYVHPGINFLPKGEIIGQIKIFRPDGTLKKIIKGKALKEHQQMMLENDHSVNRYNNSINS